MRKILLVEQAVAGDVLAGACEIAAEHAQAFRFIQIARLAVGFPAMCGGHGDRLGSHSQGAHHAGRTEGHMRGADDAAREEEIGDIAAVERAVGNAIHATGLPMRAASQGAVNPL